MHLVFLTPTYSGDRERVELQRESFDRCGVTIPQVLVVETEDLAAFASFAGPGVSVVPSCEVLPPGVEKARRFHKQGLVGRLWAKTALRRVCASGWITQQLIKLSGDALCGNDWVCLDSDVVFVRPFDKSLFLDSSGLRCVRLSGLSDDRPLRYRRASEEFFGVAPAHQARSHFTYPMFPMERAVVSALRDDIARRCEADWWQPILQGKLTEFAAYGVYATRVMNRSTYRPDWLWLEYDTQRVGAHLNALRDQPNFIGAMVHSQLELPVEALRSTFDALWRAVGLD